MSLKRAAILYRRGNEDAGLILFFIFLMQETADGINTEFSFLSILPFSKEIF